MRPLVPLLLLLGAVGCSGGEPRGGDEAAPSATTGAAAPDQGLHIVAQSGDTLRLTAPPRRIVALIPAINEILIDLGAADRLAGRTRYDSAPEVMALPSVGEGLGPDMEALLALEPDLVIRFGGPTDTETPAQLDRLGIPHLAVRPDRIEDIRHLHLILGELTGQERRADDLVAGLDATLDSVARSVAALPSATVSYLLGADPPWAAGPQTYIGELVALAGGQLRPENLPPLYTQLSPEALLAADVEVILVSGDGTLDARLAEGRRVEEVPQWVEIPGPDLRRAAWFIARLIHPELGATRGDPE